ncbi:MAG: hypothetical protein H5T69_18535, partial [Chloroflexi bacterium]|nr:hypothetical protein [Chloroflexota bacterium]
TITFYWAVGTPNAGTVAHTFNDVIEAGKSKTYYVPAHIPGLPNDFVGSAVVTADQPVAAILNTTRTDGTNKRIGAATGVLSPATKVFAPYLRKDYYGRNSYIAIQNTSDQTATVTVTYYDHTGAQIAAATENLTIPPYTTAISYQDQNANLPGGGGSSGFHGSAVIEGNQPLAVVVNNANSGTSPTTSGFESYNGQGTGATKLYLPKLTVNYYDYQSSFTVQNAGTAATAVNVEYNFGGTTYTHSNPSLAPGAAWPVYLASPAQSNLPSGISGSGSAIITASQPLLAVVTEVYEQGDKGFAVITSAVPDGTGTSTVLFPKFARTYYNYNGGIQIQNIGTQPTVLTATFSQAGRTDVVVTSPTIQPGGSYFWYGPNVTGLTENFGGSVTVVSSNGQPIAGIYTERNDTEPGDSYTAYNGIQK